jgi:hypothetical protein
MQVLAGRESMLTRCCSTPIRVTLACWLLGTRSGHLIDANEHGC